jgi:hypothetical protein
MQSACAGRRGRLLHVGVRARWRGGCHPEAISETDTTCCHADRRDLEANPELNHFYDKKGILLLCRHSNGLNLKIYYKQYCKVLSEVILAAKKYFIIKSFLLLKTKRKALGK